MTTNQELLDELIEAWRYAREGFLAEAENIPGPDWSFRPTPENRDVTELVRHILEASLMAVGEVTNPGGDFTRQGFQEHLAEHATGLPETADRAEWLRLLRETLEAGCERLRGAGPLLLEPIRQFNGEFASRLSWFHHQVAHEEYHRGQLAMYARLTGHVPALTQKIRGG